MLKKAIAQSDLGLNPNNDGNVIRIQIPELTTERRQELTRYVAKLAEEGTCRYQKHPTRCKRGAAEVRKVKTDFSR